MATALIDRVTALQEEELDTWVDSLTQQEAALLLYDWRGFWARPKQIAPEGDWRVWMVLAGRGFGKTRLGAEWIIEQAMSGAGRRMALVARTAADCIDTMIEGESGILACSPPWFYPHFQRGRRKLIWPNGATATYYYAESPDMLRGPQHDKFWADELAAWKYPQAWDMLMLGLRLGLSPSGVVTTTPRPTRVIKKLAALATTALTEGTTYENVQHLAPSFLAEIVSAYEGTRLGAQEIYAKILDDNPNALWKRGPMIEDVRAEKLPDLNRIVVGVDPPATGTDPEASTECGIVVAGRGVDGHCYILEDVSLVGSPDAWGKQAVAAYHKYGANLIVAEVNMGGDMVEHVLHTVDKLVKIKTVHASRGKFARAEPIAALAEQGRMHHVGIFADLEEQLCNWSPDTGQRSPDRLDAYVWAATELMVGRDTGSEIMEHAKRRLQLIQERAQQERSVGVATTTVAAPGASIAMAAARLEAAATLATLDSNGHSPGNGNGNGHTAMTDASGATLAPPVTPPAAAAGAANNTSPAPAAPTPPNNGTGLPSARTHTGPTYVPLTPDPDDLY